MPLASLSGSKLAVLQILRRLTPWKLALDPEHEALGTPDDIGERLLRGCEQHLHRGEKRR
jgi:hypothetical protein